MTRPFSLVDVFAESPFAGNPLAVVTGAEGLDTAEMLRITQWLNLSETTFLLPPEHPDADYKVRIFTLEREMPFAGHPTLGTCHVWLENGGVPKNEDYVVQECGAGLVKVKRGERLAFAAPALLHSGPLDDAKLEELCSILQIARGDVIDHQWLDNGPGWAGVLLKSAEAVRAVTPQRDVSEKLKTGIIGPTGTLHHLDIGLMGPSGDAGVDWELRALFTNHTGVLIEDPVTGSLNAAAGQWLIGSGRATAPYVASQGACIGRAGRIHVSQSDGEIWVGGATRTLFKGEAAF